MSALHWLLQKSDRVVGVIHLDHNTPYGSKACEFVQDVVSDSGLPLHLRKLTRTPELGHSPENWWREQRYRFFKEVSAINDNIPIILAHNLDDCLEEYVMCTMVRGYPSTIPYQHPPCIRPFRLWSKSDIYNYAALNEIKFLEDPSNQDPKYKRNLIRHQIIPPLLKLNPGVYQIVKRLILKEEGIKW